MGNKDEVMSCLETERIRNMSEKLYKCLRYGGEDYRTVKELVWLYDASPNMITKEGISSFHFIAGCKNEHYAVEVAKLFLQHGGNPNVQDDDGLTPVHVAALLGKIKMLQLLLKNGGDPFKKDIDGNDTFYFANQEEQWDVISLLQEFYSGNSFKENEDEEQKYTLSLDKLIVAGKAFLVEYEEIDDQKMRSFDIPGERNIINGTSLDSNELFLIRSDSKGTISTTEKSEVNSYNESEFYIPRDVPPEQKISIGKIDDSLITEDMSDLCDPKRYSYNSSIFTEDNTDFGEESHCSSFTKVGKWLANMPLNYAICSDEDTSIGSFKSANSHESSNSDNCLNANTAFRVTSSSSLGGSSTTTFVTVSEQYRYTDEEEGVVLLEGRLPVNQIARVSDIGGTTDVRLCKGEGADHLEENVTDNSSCSTEISTIPSTFNYDTDNLRSELTKRGCRIGPITKSTKRVYLKQLYRLHRKPPRDIVIKDDIVYSPELMHTLRNSDWLTNLASYKELEQVLYFQFAKRNPSRRWREGQTKSSFTYLLLDPTITENLPSRSATLTPHQTWKIFLSSIFYIGKGKRSRPYSHLYQAVEMWNKNILVSTDKKIQHILDIWKASKGVVCLHAFQNVIPVEAYTREAAMIDAMGVKNLKNIRSSEYYGIAATWTLKEKRKLGVYLLYKAMLIFLNEGERQLCPEDI